MDQIRQFGALIAALVALPFALLAATKNDRGGRILNEAEKLTCEANGGRVVVLGVLGNEICLLPLADAGKACRNSDECLGDCVPNLDGVTVSQRRNISNGTELPGICERTHTSFGCRETIEGGRFVSGLCID